MTEGPDRTPATGRDARSKWEATGRAGRSRRKATGRAGRSEGEATGRAARSEPEFQSDPTRTLSVSPTARLRPAVPDSLARTAGPSGRTATDPDVLSSTDDGTSAREKAQRPPASWDNFGPPPPPAATVGRRVVTAFAPVGVVLRHEWTLAGLGGLLLALALNLALPYLLTGVFPDPRRTLPQDIWDPSLVAYLIAWGGHALTHDPTTLWHLNGFYPAPYGLAYTDSLLGYAPAAIVGSGAEIAVLRYNIIYLLAHALVFTGAYALARQLGADRVGAAVAGVAFAVAPWRLAQAGHLQVLSAGGIALALAMLARGHGVRWRRRDPLAEPDAPAASREPSGFARPGWAFAGWLVAAWQLTIGFGIGLVFSYVLLGAFLLGGLWWTSRRRALPPPWLLIADAAGGLIFAGVALLLAQPYLKVLELYPYARRNADWVALYSPPLRGWLTAPAESLLWGGAHAGSRAQLSLPGEMALLPGFMLCALALAGLIFSIWPVRVRLALAAGVAATVVLGLGTNGPAQGRAGYLALFALPGFEGLRTPGRFVMWTTLLLALLAAGAVGGLIERSRVVAEHRRGVPQPTALATLALLAPLALVLVEGLGTTPHPTVPTAPAVLSTVPAPYLVLPSDQVGDMHVLLWSTDRFAATVNGGSGVVPIEQQRTRDQVANFPDPASVAYLRELGVASVVVLNARAADTDWADAAEAPIDGLGITRRVTDEAVVFQLSG